MSRKLAWLAVAVCVAVQPSLYGKGPKLKLENVPGEAWFDAFADPDAAECTGNAPGIRSDSDASYVGAVTEAGALGAYLSMSGEFYLTLNSGGSRALYMNFTDVITAPADPSFFRKEFCERWQDQLGFDTHVLDEDGLDDISLTLLDIVPGQARPSRVRVNFLVDVDGEDVRFTLRYNSAHYPLSNDVLITRGPADLGDVELADEWSWLIETQAPPNDKAFLHSPTRGKNLRKLGKTDEGSYHMPFRVVFTIDPADLPQ